jgi:hypothetical protein
MLANRSFHNGMARVLVSQKKGDAVRFSVMVICGGAWETVATRTTFIFEPITREEATRLAVLIGNGLADALSRQIELQSALEVNRHRINGIAHDLELTCRHQLSR